MEFIKKHARNIKNRFIESNDLMKFLWKAKLWFLIPIIILLLLFALLFAVAQATGVAPFIYTLI